MNICKLTSICNLIGSGYELKNLGSIPGGKKLFHFIASKLALERPRPPFKKHHIRNVDHLAKHIYKSHGSHVN